jgi:hypothetical protein
MAKNFNVEVEFKASGHPELEKAINSLVRAQKNLRNGQVQYNKTLTKSNAAIATLEKRNKALTKSIVSTNNAFEINAKTGAVVAKNNRLLTNSFATVRSQLLLISFGIGIATSSIGRFVNLTAEQELAEKKLEAALGFTNQGLLDYASALQRSSVFGDEAILTAQALLAAFIKDEEQLKLATKATIDLAAAKGMDLNAAADLIGKSIGSSTNALSRYGIEVEGAVGSTQRLESATSSIARLYGGQALAQSLTLSGAMRQLANTFGDFQEKVGGEFVNDVRTLVISLNLFFQRVQENEEGLKNLAQAIKLVSIAAVTLILPVGKVVKGLNGIRKSLSGVTSVGTMFTKIMSQIKNMLFSTGTVVFGVRAGMVALADSYDTASLSIQNYDEILGKSITGKVIMHEAAKRAVADQRTEISFAQKYAEAIEKELEIRNKAIQNGKLANQTNQDTLQQQNLLRKQSMDLMAAKAKENVFNQQDLATIQAQVAIRDAYFKATNQMLQGDDGRLLSMQELEFQLQSLTGFEKEYLEALIATQKQLLENKEIQEDRAAVKAQIQGYQQIGQAIQQFAGENKSLAIVALRIQQIAAVAAAYAAANEYIADQRPVLAAAALATGLANAAQIQEQIKKANSVALARGGSFVTEGEQFIKVGDNAGGRERVTVTPLSTPAFGDAVGNNEGITVNIMGNVIGTQEFVRDNLLPEIENTIRNNLA